MFRFRVSKTVIGHLVAILCLIPVPYVIPGYTAYVIQLLMYISMSIGWNILGGYLGDLSFGHAAFFGVGAYTVAMLDYYGICHFSPLNILLGGLLSMFIAASIGYPFLKLRGFYFAIGTLGLAEILRVVYKDLLRDYTRGARGILVPTITPYTVQPYYYAILALTFGIMLVAGAIVNSKLGLAFRAIRDDMDSARMSGINATAHRILGFSISAFIVGVIGGFFVYYTGYAHPEGVFSQVISFELLIMVYFGGVGTVLGPIVGAIIVFIVEEVGRALIQQGYLLLLAIMLIIVFILMPGGVVGTVTKKTPFINPLRARRRKLIGSA